MPDEHLADNKVNPGTDSPTPMVRVEGIHHHYTGADTPALNDIHLTIPEGCCFGLLGPNGAGKTTLISLLTGVLAPQQGVIHVGGFSFPREAQQIKYMSGLVPQDYAFYPALTGRENLQFFAGLYQIPELEFTARMEFCVEVCGLAAVLDQRACNYSGGIKRRLNIALGLLNNPKILYLDEPTVGIDAQSRNFILESIKQLKNSGMTIIYTSHYMEEVEQLCDEVAIIDHGRVLLQEPMSNLLQGGRQMVVTPINVPDAEVLAALAEKLVCHWDGEHLTLEPAEQLPFSQMLVELELLGIDIGQLHMGSNKLEETYLRVTHPELRQ
ncbi:MAG TPA: ABC transporter ATP-binding protein [Porticoccus sp.]|nr:ABC transporter ATP-binding protein [Porticoccus sp.]